MIPQAHRRAAKTIKSQTIGIVSEPGYLSSAVALDSPQYTLTRCPF